MRLTASLAALAIATLALGACKQSEPAPGPADAATGAASAAAEVPGGLAIDGLPNTGVFEVNDASGKKRTTTTLADGTTTVVEDGMTKKGTWTSTGPGNYCSTFDGKTTCYKEEMINGVFTSTSESDPKDIATVKRVSAGVATAMPPPGDYLSSTPDGKPVAKVTLNADGSYLRDPEEGLNEAGIAKMTDGKLCFDPSGKDKPNRCHTLSPAAADGSFTAIDDKGAVLNVRPAAK